MCVCIYLYVCVLACMRRRQPCSPDNLIKQINVRSGQNAGRKSAEPSGFGPHVTGSWSILGLYLTFFSSLAISHPLFFFFSPLSGAVFTTPLIFPVTLFKPSVVYHRADCRGFFFCIISLQAKLKYKVKK